MACTVFQRVAAGEPPRRARHPTERSAKTLDEMRTGGAGTRQTRIKHQLQAYEETMSPHIARQEATRAASPQLAI